jgi:hypothetical protein
MEITEHGKKMVASEDFAKCLVHVVEAFKHHDRETMLSGVSLYVAAALATDDNNVVSIPSNQDEAKVFAAFMNENHALLKETIHNVINSPAFLAHALPRLSIKVGSC